MLLQVSWHAPIQIPRQRSLLDCWACKGRMQVASVPCDLVQSHFQGDMPHVQDQHGIIQKGARGAQAEATQGAPETGYTSCAKLPRAPQNNQCASESPHDHQDETKWKIPCGDEKETGVLENKLLHRSFRVDGVDNPLRPHRCQRIPRVGSTPSSAAAA